MHATDPVSSRRPLWVLKVALLLAVVLASPVRAQTSFVRPEAARPPSPAMLRATHSLTQGSIPAASLRTLPPIARRPIAGDAALIAGGIAGGAQGLAAGAAIGYGIESASCSDDEWFCGLAGLIIGGMVGEAIGLPLGVHLANGRRGSYSASLLASFGLTAAGIAGTVAAADSAENVGGALVVAVPIGQLVAAITIERRTARP